MRSFILKRALHAPNPVLHSLLAPRGYPNISRRHMSVPTILSPYFWKSMLPKPIRRRLDGEAPKKAKSKEWNPATFYIIIFMLIGSMSINMIKIRKEHAHLTRRAETRIGILKEVVKRLQRGEQVDVERELGTGDREQEKEWAEVVREFERDPALREDRRDTKRDRANESKTKAENERSAAVEDKTSDADQSSNKVKTTGYSSFF